MATHPASISAVAANAGAGVAAAADAVPPRVSARTTSVETKGALAIHALLAVALAALYAPILRETAAAWMTNENYAHGIFIFPAAAALVWRERARLQALPAVPDWRGLPPLAFGLFMETIGYLLDVKFLAFVSLVPTLCGLALLVRGREFWRAVRFPVLFLALAAPLPGMLLTPPTNWIQSASATGAVAATRAAGVPIAQTGNIIDVPGASLEVAEACSGFKKLIALLAFGLYYGAMVRADAAARTALVAAAVPIAVLANVLRISVLIGIAAFVGPGAISSVHDIAEIGVLIVSFLLFVGFGRLLGCTRAAATAH